MQKLTLPLKTLIISLLFSMPINAQEKPMQIIDKMLEATSQIRTLEVTMVMNERIKDGINKKKARFKIMYNPVKVYLKQEYPQKGMEVLFVEGANDGKAWVYPNGFPWVTLSLDPNSKLMREGHHQPVYNAGFKYFTDLVRHLFTKYKNDVDKMLVYDGIVKLSETSCHKLTFNNPNFSYSKYRVQPGETVVSIARKMHVNEYMIVENNPGISGYEEKLDGKEITVPTDYARTVVLYITKDSYLPYGIKVFDEKGLFQEYYFIDAQINPVFDKDEFTTGFKGYNF